jgi:hypothetical protein
VVGLVVLGTTGFTTYVLTRTEPTELDSIGCYDRATLDANVAVIGGSGDPVAACRRVWGDGGFPGAPVPARLAACVLESGAIAVFPATRDTTCRRLGLSSLSAAGARESRRFARLKDDIVRRLGAPATGATAASGPCVGQREAQVVVRRLLARHGYGDWTIEVIDPFTARRPCTDVSFDGGSQTVLLVPGERRGPPR